MAVHATDAPDNIGDFSSLTIEVTKISVKHKGGDGEEKETLYDPATPTFDLVKLQAGNLTTLFSGKVAAGNYTRLEIQVTKATGILKVGGATVDVAAPKGSIFVNQHFTVGEGAEVDFLFDIHVVIKGTGGYSLQPNAGGSHTIAKPKNGKVPG